MHMQKCNEKQMSYSLLFKSIYFALLKKAASIGVISSIKTGFQFNVYQSV